MFQIQPSRHISVHILIADSAVAAVVAAHLGKVGVLRHIAILLFPGSLCLDLLRLVQVLLLPAQFHVSLRQHFHQGLLCGLARGSLNISLLGIPKLCRPLLQICYFPGIGIYIQLQLLIVVHLLRIALQPVLLVAVFQFQEGRGKGVISLALVLLQPLVPYRVGV